MKKFFALLTSLLLVERNLYAAEAGMPQLNPEFWISQIFWLIITFGLLFIVSDVNSMHHLNKCMLKLQIHKPVKKQLKFLNLLKQLKNLRGANLQLNQD